MPQLLALRLQVDLKRHSAIVNSVVPSERFSEHLSVPVFKQKVGLSKIIVLKSLLIFC